MKYKMYYFKNKKQNKTKGKKKYVAQPAKNLFDKETRNVLSLLQKTDAFTVLNFRSYRVEKFRFLKPNWQVSNISWYVKKIKVAISSIMRM